MSAGLRRNFHSGGAEQLHRHRHRQPAGKPEGHAACGHRPQRCGAVRQQRRFRGYLCPASGGFAGTHRQQTGARGEQRLYLDVPRRHHRFPGGDPHRLLWHRGGLRIHDGVRYHPGRADQILAADPASHHPDAGNHCRRLFHRLFQRLFPASEPDHGLHAHYPGGGLFPQGGHGRQRRADRAGGGIQRPDGTAANL